jgi:hypothetical protein
MNSLGIITINFNRPKIIRLWCAQIKRLREQFETYIPAVVVSGKEDETICNQYHVVHITQQNDPVTEKWNTAMAYMRSIGIDYVMIIGSDDIVSTGFVRKTMEQMERGIDYIGTKVFYFFCGQGLDRGKLVKLDTAPTKGIGKTISKYVLDQCDWRLWDKEKNWGMDAIATKNIVQYARSRVLIEDIIVDIKTTQNLNSFRIWSNRLPQVDSQLFYDILSEEELQILKSL